MSSVRCPHCSRPLRAQWDTDPRGELVESIEFCGCRATRRRAHICRYCPLPVDKPRSSYCGDEHRAQGTAEDLKRYYASEKGEELRKRENKKRRSTSARARRRTYERARYQLKEVRDRRLKSARRARVTKPELKAAQQRRYKEKYPERVAAQQAAANARRAVAKREHMHRYCTKYVGPGKAPTCASCPAIIPFAGTGRPMKRCATCDPKAWRDRARRLRNTNALTTGASTTTTPGEE